MGSLSFRDVADVDLGKLGTSIADWKKTVDNLKSLADSAEKRLLARSEPAHWAGVNAGVTREFIKKTSKELSDAHAEADTIWGLLNDAHRELVGIQEKMQTAIETDAPNLGVRIEDTGDGGVRRFFPHIRGDNERKQAQLDEAVLRGKPYVLSRSAVRAALALGLVPLLLALAACGGDERDYTVPTSLCGTPVDSELLEPLLPIGKEIGQKEGFSGQEGPKQMCTVRVDGKAWLVSHGEWRAGGYTALDAVRDRRGRGGEHAADGGKLAYWDQGAATVVPCRSEKWKAQTFSVVVESVYRDGRKGDIDALKAFVESYGKAVAERLPCA